MHYTCTIRLIMLNRGMKGINQMTKKDNPQLETISFETISKVVKNCTTPKKTKLIPMTEEEEYRNAGITKEEINDTK